MLKPILLCLLLSSCNGLVTGVSLGLSHGENRVDATIHFKDTGKKVVPTK